MILDESTASLDVSIQARVLDLLRELQRSWASPTCSSLTISPWCRR